jgi:hypothetical protein
MQGLTSSRTPRAASKAIVLMVVGMTLLLAVHLCYTYPSLGTWKIPTNLSKYSSTTPNATEQVATTTTTTHPTPPIMNKEEEEEEEEEEALPCQSLTGGQEVLVVMRTGATEISDKLPAHLSTTFKCYPNTLILSDYAEDFQGHRVHDVLSDIDQDLKHSHPDFALWRRLRAHGRGALADSELSGAVSRESGATGKVDNEGWRLDKWKFLPMAARTLELHPDMKWYVFVEPDTYLIWSNLLAWLQRLDPSEPLYYGSEVQIDSDIFAHGGSSFVISNPALKRVAALYEANAADWHALTSAHWAGDCILGKALAESGTPLTWTWPMIQGGNPNTMDFAEAKANRLSLWCAPALSYHHLSPAEITSLFAFEQDWLRRETMMQDRQQQQQRSSGGSTLPASHRDRNRNRLHHRDVFQQYIQPQITRRPERANWTNLSPDLRAGTQGSSLEECKAMCESASECVQYSLSEMGCWFSPEVRVGRPAEEEEGERVSAGWLPEKVGAWADQRHGSCGAGAGGWTVT